MSDCINCHHPWESHTLLNGTFKCQVTGCDCIRGLRKPIERMTDKKRAAEISECDQIKYRVRSSAQSHTDWVVVATSASNACSKVAKVNTKTDEECKQMLATLTAEEITSNG